MIDRSAAQPSPLLVARLDRPVPYRPVWMWQRQLASARKRGELGDILLMLEHEHVYTNGWRGDRSNLLADQAMLERIGACYVEVERGGDITYHGPGQLVCYPIVDIRSVGLGVRNYVHALEQVVIASLGRFGVDAYSIPGMVGVWSGDEKIAAIGVKVMHGIAYHGLAVNVCPDLTYFDHIVPCGLEGRSVTSLTRLIGRLASVEEFAAVTVACFGDYFGRYPENIEWRQLPGASGLLTEQSARGSN